MYFMFHIFYFFFKFAFYVLGIPEQIHKKSIVNVVYKQLADIKLLPECEKITHIVISYFSGITSLYPVYVFLGTVLAAAALPLNASLAQIEALLELLSLYTHSYKVCG